MRVRWVVAVVGVVLVASFVRAEEPARERVSELLTRGSALERAERVHPSIWLASGNSNAYLVTTPAGSVLIDTGSTFDPERTHAALAAVPGLASKIAVK